MTCLENLYLRTESLDGDSMEREEFRREADRLSLVHECQVHSAVPQRQRAHVEAEHHPGEGPGDG